MTSSLHNIGSLLASLKRFRSQRFHLWQIFQLLLYF